MDVSVDAVAAMWLVHAVDDVFVAVAAATTRLLRAAKLIPSSIEADRSRPLAVLTEDLRPAFWTPAADRFTRNRIRPEPVGRLFPTLRHAIGMLERVRDEGRPVEMEYELNGRTFAHGGRTRFVIEPIVDVSRIVGLTVLATRFDGSPIYSCRNGWTPEVGLALASIRCAARDAVVAEVRPLLPALRAAATPATSLPALRGSRARLPA